MAKFLPVVGELATGMESFGKLVAAGVTAPFNPKAGKKLLKSSGDAWKNYTNENAIACAVRGDKENLKKSADTFSQACPGVAHVRGAVHLVRGEGEEGYTCLANGTKGLGVAAATVAVTIATGGLGAVPACAIVGGAAAGSQVALDGVDTGIRSAAKRKFEPAGTWAGAKLAVETKDAVHIVDAVMAPVQTAALAAGGAAIARGVSSCQATAAAAAEQELAGTGQSLQSAQARPNAALTRANLDALPPRPAGHPSALPAQPPGPSAGHSVAPSHGATSASSGVSTATGSSSVVTSTSSQATYITCISEVSEAYSAATQAQILKDASIEFSNRSLQHAWDRHNQQLPLGPGAPQNWSNATAQWFRTWLRNQLDGAKMHDLTYRGVGNHRIFYNPGTGVGIVFKVVQRGAGMDFVAAFPLSPQQAAHVLSHGGRLN